MRYSLFCLGLDLRRRYFRCETYRRKQPLRRLLAGQRVERQSMSGQGGRQREGDVLLEFHQVGSAVKVTAIDEATGIEAVIQGPASMPQSVLARNAVNKLKYVLARRSQD